MKTYIIITGQPLRGSFTSMSFVDIDTPYGVIVQSCIKTKKNNES